MKSADPIASATLARLYMTQGHWARAQAILDEVLGRTPLDGDALALRARLRPGRPRLTATFDGDHLSLRWQGVHHPQDVHVVIAVWGGDDPVPRPWVTSRRCTSAFGRHQLPTPYARGMLVASLGRVDRQGYAPACVAEPLGWG